MPVFGNFFRRFVQQINHFPAGRSTKVFELSGNIVTAAFLRPVAVIPAEGTNAWQARATPAAGWNGIIQKRHPQEIPSHQSQPSPLRLS